MNKLTVDGLAKFENSDQVEYVSIRQDSEGDVVGKIVQPMFQLELSKWGIQFFSQENENSEIRDDFVDVDGERTY